MSGAVRLVASSRFLCLNRQFAYTGDSITTDDIEIGENLVDLRRVHVDWPETGAGHPELMFSPMR